MPAIEITVVWEMNKCFLYLNSDEESQAVRIWNRQKIVVVMNRNLNEDQEIVELN